MPRMNKLNLLLYDLIQDDIDMCTGQQRHCVLFANPWLLSRHCQQIKLSNLNHLMVCEQVLVIQEECFCAGVYRKPVTKCWNLEAISCEMQWWYSYPTFQFKQIFYDDWIALWSGWLHSYIRVLYVQYLAISLAFRNKRRGIIYYKWYRLNGVSVHP